MIQDQLLAMVKKKSRHRWWCDSLWSFNSKSPWLCESPLKTISQIPTPPLAIVPPQLLFVFASLSLSLSLCVTLSPFSLSLSNFGFGCFSGFGFRFGCLWVAGDQMVVVEFVVLSGYDSDLGFEKFHSFF